MCVTNAQDMFKEAALVQLCATCWQHDKKLPQSLLADISNADTDYLRARKVLLNPEVTAPIKLVIGKARNYLRRICLPFPITGCLLVPKRLIPEVQDRLKELEAEYNSAVQDFLYDYPQNLENAKNYLGDLFNELDYPDEQKIRNRFRFSWKFITIGASNQKVLPASIYREEMEKFHALMEQAKTDAMYSLREEFANLVSTLSDKLSGSDDGRPKRFTEAAVENLKDFLDSFHNRNLFRDDELSDLVEQCRNIIIGTNASQIRSNAHVKQAIHNQMDNLLEQIDSQFVNLPVRKLRFQSAA